MKKTIYINVGSPGHKRLNLDASIILAAQLQSELELFIGSSFFQSFRNPCSFELKKKIARNYIKSLARVIEKVNPSVEVMVTINENLTFYEYLAEDFNEEKDQIVVVRKSELMENSEDYCNLSELQHLQIFYFPNEIIYNLNQLNLKRTYENNNINILYFLDQLSKRDITLPVVLRA